MSKPKFILYETDAEAYVIETELPTRKAVCHGCNGSGKHVNRNIDGNGITSDEMAELGDDFREDYMSGVYDVTCDTCGGANVVDELDEDRCTPAQLEAYQKQEEERWRDWESEAWLRRAEGGY